jgi:hypothetical protein
MMGSPRNFCAHGSEHVHVCSHTCAPCGLTMVTKSALQRMNTIFHCNSQHCNSQVCMSV